MSHVYLEILPELEEKNAFRSVDFAPKSRTRGLFGALVLEIQVPVQNKNEQ